MHIEKYEKCELLRMRGGETYESEVGDDIAQPKLFECSKGHVNGPKGQPLFIIIGALGDDRLSIVHTK